MSTLSKEFRRQLENTVLKAREEAERGGAAALEAYGVGDARRPSHLDKDGADLRNKLRAHGRQVGDVRRPDDSQEVEHLIHECAYEHWHRMLFARFLAENGFLIEPESGLDVDLDFCEERARETKGDKWEVAGGFAQWMLPGIFRPDDPVLRLRLPAESRNGLITLLAGLPRDVFLADDSLGWVYQFWQAKKKAEVNASEVPIGANELAAVTQLFTEDYMVEFLLHNTLGAWWAGRLAAANSDRFSVASCPTEEAARKACVLPGVDWKYLRFVQKDGKWVPAAGVFDGWPKRVRELRVLDPCMGSGHFPVFALLILVRMRMVEEGLSAADACVAVLRDSLFGLELDPRCTQIAAFNLALAAWKLGGYQKELPLNLACSGLGLNTRKEDWLKLAEGNPNLRFAMGALYELFQKAPVLGSLINPRRDKSVTYSASLQELQPLLQQALQRETTDEAHELAITAQGVAKAAEILAGQFTLVATNVPYLKRGKQSVELADFADERCPDAKADLATMFMRRCQAFVGAGASCALVTPHTWQFLGAYRKFRDAFLRTASIDVLAQLGAGAFETISGEVVNVCLVTFTHTAATESWDFAAADLSACDTPSEKAKALIEMGFTMLGQVRQLSNPDARIVFADIERQTLLSSCATALSGFSAGDSPRFDGLLWEVPIWGDDWEFCQTTVDFIQPYGGRSTIIFWEKERGQMYELAQSVRHLNHAAQNWLRGKPNWGKLGVVVSQMGDLPATIYHGDRYDCNCCAIVPNDVTILPAVWAFCSSPEFSTAVRQVDRSVLIRLIPKSVATAPNCRGEKLALGTKRISMDRSIKVTPHTLLKVGFDLAHWQKVAAEKYPAGLPKPFSSDPTQWLFNGHPKGSEHPLQVGVARLLGFRWPRQTGSSFPDCPALDPDGLEKHADDDGIVCFSQARDEAPAATRLRALLADAYGKEWSYEMERKLITATGSKAESLEDWLVNDFFAQHCEVFQKHPFVWHTWDGRKDGFNALVNYHKLAGPDGEGHRTLETLTFAYLGDWIARQRDAVKRGEAGADDRLDVAHQLQGELKNIIAGEPPYDLFIRWKPLHLQPVGWNPDINDGMRLNIRAFMAASIKVPAPTKSDRDKKREVGILRVIPSVRWDKDRGKEPSGSKEDFPWFWRWDGQTVDFAGNGEFDGNRWNDCHYTTAFKRAARVRKVKA